ncbi:hypothetical protein [Luteimonas huabeiensis]|uniref:hypothetical protein n=1 Tax=Luteimonas huabeiensis TaxID=1244513 RepID=UPI00046481BC|nr:hypothetical protein [Luteimonas huabeiensis]
MSAQRLATALLSAGLLVLATACRPASTDEATSSPQAAEPLRVAEIIAGPPGAAASPRPATPTDPVEIVLRTAGHAAAGSALEVKLIALADGQTVGAETVRLEAGGSEEHIVRFEREAPWTPGRYLVEVTLDGNLAGHQELEIHPAELATGPE